MATCIQSSDLTIMQNSLKTGCTGLVLHVYNLPTLLAKDGPDEGQFGFTHREVQTARFHEHASCLWGCYHGTETHAHKIFSHRTYPTVIPTTAIQWSPTMATCIQSSDLTIMQNSLKTGCTGLVLHVYNLPTLLAKDGPDEGQFGFTHREVQTARFHEHASCLWGCYHGTETHAHKIFSHRTYPTVQQLQEERHEKQKPSERYLKIPEYKKMK